MIPALSITGTSILLNSLSKLHRAPGRSLHISHISYDPEKPYSLTNWVQTSRHHAASLGATDMNQYSHSVYFAGTEWTGWSENSGDGNGGGCGGINLSNLGGACQNFDHALGSRINCVLPS